MRAILALALLAVIAAAGNLVTTRPADARISCTHHYGCVEGKYARKPIAGMTCRNATSKRPGRRYHFFCMPA